MLSQQNSYASKLQSPSTIRVTKGNANRINNQYRTDSDGFPNTIGQGNVCVLFYGNPSSIAELNRPSRITRTLSNHDVTLMSVTHAQDRNPSSSNNDLKAVVYDRNGNRAGNWNQTQGGDRLVSMVNRAQN